MPRIPLGDWVNSTVDWLLGHMAWLFDFCKSVFTGFYDGINAVLQAPHPLLLAGIFAVLAWWLRGSLAGVLTFVGFAFIDSMGLWSNAMVTLSLRDQLAGIDPRAVAFDRRDQELSGGGDARHRAVAVRGADRAVGDRLLVDL